MSSASSRPVFQPYIMTSNPASACTFTSATASGPGSGTGYITHSLSNHRIHPPPAPSNYIPQSQSQSHSSEHRIHPPPYPYNSNGVYYLPPTWPPNLNQPTEFLENPWHQAETPTQLEDGHVIGQEHEISPHPFVGHMYSTQQLPPTLAHTQSLPNFKQHGPLDTTAITHEYEHQEGEEEISPALSRRLIDSDSLIDPELELDEEILEELEGDEYQPTSAAQRNRKGKGKGTNVKKGKGGTKGNGKAKGKGHGNSKAKSQARGSGAKQPRTSARSEVRPANPSTHPTDEIYGVYDTDSHITTDYFPNLKNITYPLLAAPPGTFLDVNDLLILHPPVLSSDASHEIINQYNKSVDTTTERWLAEMGKSKFEMYTCRGCRKTYDGKNARSVARRHLQDKHGIPLSQQARRTRWDIEGNNRPLDAAEAQERSKKCKRDWAKVMRQQRSLEKLHGDFLLQFGPAGLKTTWKHPLIAPLYRDSGPAPHSQDDDEPWKTADEVKIPRSLLESASLLIKLESAVENGTSMPFTSFEDLLHLDSDTDVENNDGKKVVTSNGSLITLPTSPLRPNFQPYTSTPVSSARGQTDHQTLHDVDNQDGPIQTFPGRRRIKNKVKANDSSPATTDSSLEGDYSLRPVAGPSHDTPNDEEYDEHPPLWVAPAWQEYHEYPSTSSAGIRAIGQALLAENHAEMGVPSIRVSHPRAGDYHGEEAAETLLDLHSTPARGGESDRSPTPEPVDAALLAHARLAIQEEQDRGHRARNGSRPRSATTQTQTQTQENWVYGIPELIKNYSSFSSVSSRPDNSKVKHQFLQRPGIMQRSLSTTILDDPFVLDNTTPQAKATTSQNNHRAHGHLTGSPVVNRNASGSKRKVPPVSPLHRMRAPLNPITSNRSHPTNSIFAASPKKGAAGNFQTPLRPSRTANAPATGGMGWMQFSSPADPAASLGLAPTHAVPTTPGLSMIIGQDTPAGGKRGRMTPRIR